MISGFRLYGRGQELERQVETEQVTDLGTIWDRWTELSAGHASSWLLRGPRNVVKQKFEEAAGRTIASYRDNEKPLYEADWRRARTYLSHALAVDPDNATRGELRLCDGHIARINGTVHLNAALLDEAVRDFDEAQSLLPRSPDPELGLARVYVYGLKDIDKASEALKQAAKLRLQTGQPRPDAACGRLSRPGRPALVGFGERARPAAGKGPTDARRARLPNRAGALPKHRRLMPTPTSRSPGYRATWTA